MKRVLVGAVVLILALAAAIFWKVRAQREEQSGPPIGSAVLEAEGVDVSARLGARVARVLAQEGATVEVGAALILLECDEPEARLAEVRARLAAAQAQTEVAQAQADSAERQSEAVLATVGAARAQHRAVSTQRDAAEREADRVRSMGVYAAVAQHDRAVSAASGLQAQADAARATESSSARQAAAASAQARAARAQAVAAQRSADALQAMVRSAEVSVSECTITTPRRGIVDRVYYEPGELVSLAAPVVARVVDPSVLEATFYLPNADLDQARVGMTAKIVADSLPDEVFSATVRRIGLEAEFTPRNIQTRRDRDRLVYPVQLRIANPALRLRPAMNVTVELNAAAAEPVGS